MCVICKNEESKFMMSGLPGKICTKCHDAILKARSGDISSAQDYFSNITAYSTEEGFNFVQKEIGLKNDSLDDATYRAKINSILISTTDLISGYSITQYKNILTGVAVLGTGFFSELDANISDLFGVNSSAMESKVTTAKNLALTNLRKEAFSSSCNAVVGVSINFVPFSSNMIGIVASGTGVVLNSQESL